MQQGENEGLTNAGLVGRSESLTPKTGSSRDGLPLSDATDGTVDNPAHPLEDLYAEPPWRGYVNHPLQGSGVSGASFAGRGPKGYARSDDRIYEDVCDELTDATDVDASDVTVSVMRGAVTLAGEVSEKASKRRAEEIAESVRGVRDVQNHLRVRDA
jgi:hypothetical protein